jgi:arylsulfatase A-like enzyme
MKKNFSRRDFLKLLGALPLSAIEPRFEKIVSPIQQGGKSQNVIVVVFDTFSAYDISLYGYQRETTPNLARMAKGAIVYHNHHAGGNFTTPGTSSLLTGTLPWTHRAFAHNAGVADEFFNKNVFSAFQNSYRLTYTHNPWVTTILKQFRKHIDEYVKRNLLFLKNDYIIPTLFEEDEDIAIVSWQRIMQRKDDGYAYSLFLSLLYENYDKQRDAKFDKLKRLYPRGIPALSADSYFLLETAIDWFCGKVNSLPQPFLSYLHFLPPHDPYSPYRDFVGRFKDDNLVPEPRPADPLQFFINDKFAKALSHRMKYDEYILYVDREFGRLFDYLTKSGMLDNTWLVLTSDHGEMFDRGVVGHQTPLLYEPLIHIPLMIFEPGRKTRLDVHSLTSAVDLLPTLLHVTGQPPADWAEGTVLPPYSSPDNNRSAFALEARTNKKYAPITVATTALIKGQYKLIYFFGYDELADRERIELYDIKADPEEINELSGSKRETTNEMLNELKEKLAEKNKPYL